jgi:hypothetical protein
MDADTIRRFFLLLLGLTYIGLGVFMFFKKVIPISPWGEILSVAFILYGAFRVYRAMTKK